MSVYAFGLLGMAPIGTQLAGQTGALIGASPGCIAAGVVMLVLMSGAWLLTPVPDLD